jgi:carbon-monoxide dehydrogenase medium subunit
MLALDADIQIAGTGGPRTAKARDFFQDLFTVDLKPDEIITAVQFAPILPAAYAKLHQRASHYAIVGVAAALDVKDGKIQSARIGLTGAGPKAVRLSNVEQALAGKPLAKDAIESAAKIAGQGLGAVNADIHASEEYRRAMIPVFTRRALERATSRQ